MVKKVAMCGFASSSFRDIRRYYGNPEFEIWGMNQLYKLLPEIFKDEKHSFTRWFQLHHKARFLQWDPDQVKKLNELDIPIYMTRKRDDVPKSIEYPKRDILSNPLFLEQYFTNSFPWMMALAYVEGFEEVHLVGCDMVMPEEMKFQRPGVDYYIGLFRGNGRTVVINAANSIMKSFSLYGYDDNDALNKKVFKEIDLRKFEIKVAQKNLVESRDALHQFIGARDALVDIGCKDEEKFKKIDYEIQRLDHQLKSSEATIAKLNGYIEAAQFFKNVWMNKEEIQDGNELSVSPSVGIRECNKRLSEQPDSHGDYGMVLTSSEG